MGVDFYTCSICGNTRHADFLRYCTSCDNHICVACKNKDCIEEEDDLIQCGNCVRGSTTKYGMFKYMLDTYYEGNIKLLKREIESKLNH